MDKITIKKSTNREGEESSQNLDPRKLIISCHSENSYYNQYNIRFGIFNRNLQQTKDFSINDASLDYNLIDSTITYDKSKSGYHYSIKHSSNILPPPAFVNGNWHGVTDPNNRFYLKCKLTSKETGTICCYTRTDFQELEMNTPLYGNGKMTNEVAFEPGTTDIVLRSDCDTGFTSWATAAIVSVLRSSDVCEITNCYITINDELDHYIEPKHQNIELEYKFISTEDFIKFDNITNKWINSNNENLSDNDQNILNNIELYSDGCYLIPCYTEMPCKPFCLFEYQE